MNNVKLEVTCPNQRTTIYIQYTVNDNKYN